jgi:hypothetical protein
MLSVELNAPGALDFNELFLRYEKAPNRTEYDLAFDRPFSPNQALTIPALKKGTYYLMAYAVEGPDSQAVSLLARIVPFGLTSIEANKGGNTGSVTALLRGAKFDPAMKVWLQNAQGKTINGQLQPGLTFLSAFVKFDLAGVQPGKFDVCAVNAAQKGDTLINGFEVVTGTLGPDPLSVSCSVDGSAPFALNGLEPLDFESQYPASARPNQIIPLVFRVENTGTVDIPAPQRILASVGGAPLALTREELSSDQRDAFLRFVENKALPDILRPGGVAFITVYTKAIRELRFNIFK